MYLPALDLDDIVTEAQKLTVELGKQDAPAELVRLSVLLAELAANVRMLLEK